uniref:AIG1-type G domain-containing protein n=1 Tax=Rhizophora mucronata TaxID=61149 RepID=A0A2P2MRB4_RHIMU
MDSQASPPEAMSHLTGSAHSTVLTPSFDDSRNDSSVKKHSLEADNSKNGSAGGGDGESVTGSEEEFEDAAAAGAAAAGPEIPILPVPEKSLGEDDSGAPFEDCVECLIPQGEETVRKASENGEDDGKDVVGESNFGALNEGELVGDEGKGLEIIGAGVSGGKLATGFVVDGEGKEFVEHMGERQTVPEKLNLDESESRDGEVVEGEKMTEVVGGKQSDKIKEVSEKEGVDSGALELENDKLVETNDGIEPAVETAVDKSHVLASDKADGGIGEGILAIDSAALATQMLGAHEVEHLEDKQAHNGAANEDWENEVSCKADLPQVDTHTKTLVKLEAEDEEKHDPDEGSENEVSVSDGETEDSVFGHSEAAKQFLEELEQGSGVASQSAAESLHDHLHRIDGQIVTDSDEEVDADEEGSGKQPFDSAALAALLKAATTSGSDSGTITMTSQDGSRLFSVERPAGLGSSLQSMKPAPRSNRPNLFASPSVTAAGNSDNLSEEEKKKLEKLQQLRVKYLRLVHRLGYSPEESVAAQVLYRLALFAGRQTNQLFSLDAAKMRALQLEAEGNDDLDFSLNILALGKTGMGKSATINSIFGEEKSSIHAFEPATASVKEIYGVVSGVKIRVIDSPGLKSSGSEQGANRKILSSIKKIMKKCPPDIVFYVDRLDTQTRDLNDLPVLRSITSSLGSSVWRNAIVTLTHAASAPPDGPSGSPLSYEVFVAQRSHFVQQSIGQAVGDLRLMNPSLMNPVSLVENHPSCRKNRDGHKVLPNGQSWRPRLLLLCYSMKILSEASSLTKPQDPFDHRKLFGLRARSPPLPYLLSWLLQSRTHPKLSTNQGGDSIDSDIDLADFSESDQEVEDDDYDQLPPFKPLRQTQIAKLSKEQRKAYFEEYDYRVKLLQKKQWKEELKRMREIKKKGKVATDEYGYMGEDADAENEGPAAVPVPLPDMVLPPSFDGDNPAYRYRFLEPTSQFLVRPVLDTHGWDHDCGYDGVNIELGLAMANQFPAAVAVQATKDKKEFNIHLDSSISAKHGENGSSMLGFDVQNIGKQLAYILRGETKFKNLKKNKTAAGVSITFLGENVATGFKLEDQVALGKRLMLVGSTGTVRSQGDSAYGANLEVRLREEDYPIEQDQSSLSLSLVKWRGDLALGANIQSQLSTGRNSKIAVRAGLNNKMRGQIIFRTSSSDQLQIALLGLLPIAMAIYKLIRPGVSENYSIY